MATTLSGQGWSLSSSDVSRYSSMSPEDYALVQQQNPNLPSQDVLRDSYHRLSVLYPEMLSDAESPYTYADKIVDTLDRQAAEQREAAQASANIAMLFNSKEAALNRDFQERMRDTAYRAAVNDLRAAGLNPALAYGQGPAASPAGSYASGSAAQMDIAGSYTQNVALQDTLSKREFIADMVSAIAGSASRLGAASILGSRAGRSGSAGSSVGFYDRSREWRN